MTRALLTLGLLLALTGCGTSGGTRNQDLPKPPAAGDYRADVGVSTAWETDVGELPDGAGHGFVVAVSGERVYTAAADGRVSALERASGKLVWQVRLKAPLSAGPASDGERVVVGTRDGHVIALDATDGRELWLSGVTSEVQAAPRIGGGLVVARSIDGRVFGLEAATGRRLWMHQQTPPALILRRSSAPVLLPGEAVIVGQADGRLVALAAEDGRQIWENLVAAPKGFSDLERMVDIAADPVVTRSEVYVAAYQGRLAAVDLATGRIRWDREVSSYQGLAVDRSQLVVTAGDNRIWAFDRFSGGSIWRHDDLRGVALTAPALFGDHVLLGDAEGYLNWLDLRDGKLLRRERIGGRFVATPLVVDREVFLLTTDGVSLLR